MQWICCSIIVSSYVDTGYYIFITTKDTLRLVLNFFALCLVRFHVATLDESLATNLANIWSFSGVGHSVLLQMLQHSKGCATHITVVWLFTSVHSLMNATLRMQSESLLTALVATLDWLFMWQCVNI